MGKSITITLGGKTCLAPNADYSFAARLANSFFCPRGRRHGTAHILMLGADLAALNFNQPQALSISCGGTAVTFASLWPVKAVCVSGGPAGDPHRAYLVELADARFALQKFAATNRQFNVRQPAAASDDFSGGDSAEFYADSLDAGQPHNWQSLVAALWNDLPAALAGPFPGLPAAAVPSTPPEGLRYQGVDAWDALNDVLENLLNCTVVYDPIGGGFSIQQLGAPQAGLAAALANNPLYLEDADPLDGLAVQVPATVRVFFQKQSLEFGTEADTPQQNNWSDQGGMILVDVPTGHPAAVAGTVKPLHAEPAALLDFAGDTLNQAALQTRAGELAAAWLAGVLSSADRLRRTYSGTLPDFAPGSEVSWVWWQATLDGARTIVGRGPLEFDPFAEVSAVGNGREKKQSENLKPPDWARKTAPIYPRVVQLVRVLDGTKDSNGYFLGVVVRIDPAGPFVAGAPYQQLEPCLLADVRPVSHTAGEIHFGRLNGTATFYNANSPLPLYVLDSNAPPLSLVKLTQDVAHNASGTADLYAGLPGAEVDTGQVVTVFNRFTPLLEGEFALAFQPAGSQTYLIVNDEFQGRLLVQVQQDIPYGQSGEAIVLSGPVGSEEPTGNTVIVQNWFFGLALNNLVCWANSDRDGFYLTSAVGNQFVARVQSGQAGGTGTNAIDSPINCEIQDFLQGAYTGTGTVVQAYPTWAPVLDSELVWLEFWPRITPNGFKWQVVRAELDGGFFAQNLSASTVSKGQSGTFQVLTQYLDANTKLGAAGIQGFQAASPLGDIAGDALVWIERNRGGLFATSAECKQ